MVLHRPMETTVLDGQVFFFGARGHPPFDMPCEFALPVIAGSVTVTHGGWDTLRHRPNAGS
jgi:hypothetical protein